MQTFRDIEFDKDYESATYQFLLLDDYSTNRTSPVPAVPLPHAQHMTFIRRFHDPSSLEQHLRRENRKLTTLVISKESLIQSYKHLQPFEDAIDKIHIFCHTFSDYMYMKQQKKHLTKKIESVILPEQLDLKLLLFGVDYVCQVSEEFGQHTALRRKFSGDAIRLLDVLGGYFASQVIAHQ